jgi:hypothetical protein
MLFFFYNFFYGFLESHLFIEGYVSANFNLMLFQDINYVGLWMIHCIPQICPFFLRLLVSSFLLGDVNVNKASKDS